LIERTNGGQEDYQAGLQLAEALTQEFPKSPNFRTMHGIALYRVGRYTEALPHLELSQREWEKIVVGQAGDFFLMGPQALLLYKMLPLIYLDCERLAKGIAFLAMTHHRLGDHLRARAILKELRGLGDMYDLYGQSLVSEESDYGASLREAETLIEGKPRPDK
jgi:tetratricopeptide (TPR) repeat protein